MERKSSSGKKVKALRWYLGQKGSGLEEELGKALDALFLKNVPANVRGYITREPEAAYDGSEPNPHIWEVIPSISRNRNSP